MSLSQLLQISLRLEAKRERGETKSCCEYKWPSRWMTQKQPTIRARPTQEEEDIIIWVMGWQRQSTRCVAKRHWIVGTSFCYLAHIWHTHTRPANSNELSAHAWGFFLLSNGGPYQLRAWNVGTHWHTTHTSTYKRILPHMRPFFVTTVSRHTRARNNSIPDLALFTNSFALFLSSSRSTHWG